MTVVRRTTVAVDAIAIELLGESSLLVRFPAADDESLAATVANAWRALEHANLGRCELVPAMDSLAIHFAIPRLDWQSTRAVVSEAIGKLSSTTPPTERLVEIPVCYGGEFGPDLDEVARRCGLRSDDVIQQHSSATYRVRMIGFTPGFPYLTGLPAALHLPRRSEPRLAVPPGSVAIAGGQAGIYPRSSPGGWHLIGRTPRRLFDPESQPPNALALGDRVRFRPVDPEAYSALAMSP